MPGDNVPTKTRAKITKDRLSELLNDLKAKKPKVILMSDKSYERYSSTKFYDFNKYKNFLEKEYIKENNKIYEYNIYVLKNS